MIRVPVLGVVLLAAAAADLAGAPVPREDMRPPVPVAGAVWEGEGVVARTVYEFHRDGRMTLTYGGRTYANCGTWKRTGNQIYWETNNQFCEFEGTLDGTTLRGKAWNKPGGTWTLTVKLKTATAAESGLSSKDQSPM